MIRGNHGAVPLQVPFLCCKSELYNLGIENV